MRRAQVNSGSQPVRNLMTFPGFEVASGTSVVRQNLCAYPGGEMSSSTATLRTNLAPNPRGVNAYAEYQASGHTITANIPITGHPDGITTANRVTYENGMANPGVTLLNPLTSGQQYTASAWVYHETIPTGGTQGLAQAGVAAGSAPAIVATTWQRITWTFTASGTSQLGFRVSSQTGAGAYLITGILVESAFGVAPFFDGATATTTNLVKTAASQTGGVTFTENVSYAGSTWRRGSVASGTGFANVRQYVALADLGAGGKTYTISVTIANDQAFTQSLQLDWCDMGYTAITLQPGEVRRVKTTAARPAYDTTFRFADLAIGLSATEGRSVLYKDFLIEEGTTYGDYYATTGDFTYAWTGTANASTSTQAATGIGGWMGSSQGIPFQSVAGPFAGSKSVAVSTKGFTGDGAYTLDVTTIPGSTYTFSSWVKVNDVLPSFYANMRWKDAANATLSDLTVNLVSSVVVGQWTRLSYTTTAPANAVKLQAMWRIFSTHTPTVFYVDSTLIELGNTAASYFDGATAAAGDFTYFWSGTANGSISEQRAPRVQGMSGNYSNRVAWQSTDWSVTGTKSLAVLGGTPTIDSFSQFDNVSTLPATVGGKTYTFLGRLRTLEAYPAGADSRAWSFHLVYNLSGGGTGLVTCKPVTTHAGVHEVKQTFTLPATATTVSFIRFYNGSPNNVAVYWDQAAIIEGTYTGDFIDGTKPFSKWDGTADQSASVGYPPQLYDIAGKPDVDIVGAGTTANIAVDPYVGRTFYQIYEVTDNTGNFAQPMAYGNATARFLLQSSSAGSNNLAPRSDFPNGSVNANAAGTNGRVPGRIHVFAGAFADGLVSSLITINGAADTSRTYTPGDGWAEGKTTASNVTGMKPLRTLVYYADHDRDTRLAISRYLGNKYGASVA